MPDQEREGRDDAPEAQAPEFQSGGIVPAPGPLLPDICCVQLHTAAASVAANPARERRRERVTIEIHIRSTA